MKIEEHTLNADIRTFYITADSFPAGITSAHEQLKALFADDTKRNFYGVSCSNEKREIIYLAATEELFEGEAEKYNCKTLTIKSGRYISVFQPDYEKNLQNVSAIFMQLLKDPRIDREGYCIEMYLEEKNMRCMVRLKE